MAAKEDALADVLVFMCDYASREGIDLTEVLNRTWEKVCKRRAASWGADKAAEGGAASDPRTAEDIRRDVPPPKLTADKIQEILKGESGKTRLPTDPSIRYVRTVAQVLNERSTIQGCCEAYADNKGCGCLVEAETYERSQEPRLLLQPSGPYPKGSPYYLEGRKCETCGRPATNANHDTILDGSYEEHHYYCREHARTTRWLREAAKGAAKGKGGGAGP